MSSKDEKRSLLGNEGKANERHADNIDYDDTGRYMFYALVIFSELLALACVALVVAWTYHYLGGFAWDGSGKMFNYHPVFMIVGMIVLYGNSAISYRVFRQHDKFLIKLVHTLLHVGAFVFTVVGLVAVFGFHNHMKIPNMYSIHSWIGLVTVLMFSLQFLFGFLAFLFPTFEDEMRRNYLNVHAYFGGAIFTLAVVAVISGITEKMLFKYLKTYKNLPPPAVVANLLGFAVGGYFLLILFILRHPPYKRIQH